MRSDSACATAAVRARCLAVPRVLHIEDDPVNRLLVRKILSGAGFEVIEAPDGLEGVRLARSVRPDVVLVDLNIPGLDGYEVTLRLRGEQSLREVPIVAITAEGDRQTSLAVGCDGFIQKPIDVRSFAATMTSFLRGKRETVSEEESGEHLRAQSQRIVARLEAKVAELSEANARLRDADRARTAFYRNISHELATPMTPIVGYVRLLADEELGELNPSQKRAMRAMDECVTRLRALIDNLLDVTGLEAGTLRFVHADYDAASVVRRALRNAEPRLRDRTIQIVTELPERKMPAWGDGERLVRALTHVLDNAAKFTPTGGVVGVRLEHRGAHYSVCVADTGPGIAPDVLPRVIEPFFQGDASPTRAHGGTGIGLAIARRVAEGLGGSLQLVSPANERISGVTFRGAACHLSVAVRAPAGQERRG